MHSFVSTKNLNMPKLKVIIPTALISIALGSGITYFVMNSNKSEFESKSEKQVAKKAIIDSDCSMSLMRLKTSSGNQLISPLLLTELSCSTPEYDSLKSEISNYIIEQQKSGVLTCASVYMKELLSGRWFDINGSQKYNPGSLMKVAIMMTYLKKSENDPSVMDAQFALKNKVSEVVKQLRTSPELKVGSSYTVRDLITEMIVNSDNDATNLLNENLDQTMFSTVMSDLGCATPHIDDPNYQMTIMEYNRYFRVLYNASYLSKENSQWALSLLTKSNYKEAFVKELPTNVVVAHKFGERPYEQGQNFHEAGLVYLKNKPYLLVVMTRGKDSTKLPSVVSHISKMCYEEAASI
jgi:beta-lactamase class A